MIKNYFLEKKNLAFVLLLVLFLSVRTLGLGGDISNTDAYRWHYRSQNFLAAMKSRDFKSTYQHYQPGVTLMWLNAFVKQVSFSWQYRVLKVEEPKTLENADYFPVIHGVSKFAILVVLAFVLFFQMKIVEELFDKSKALWFGFLVSLEPYLIGIDRWMHLTSFEAYFGFLSLLLLLLWFKNGKKEILILSGVVLVLSVLSKITTLLTVPIYVFVIFVKKKNVGKNFAIFSVSYLISTFLLFPAFWTSPVFVIEQIYNAMTGAVGSNFSKNNFSFITGTFFYDFILLYKSSPILLAGLIGFVAAVKNYVKDFNIKIILLYLGLYYVFLTISGKKIDRYVIAMFPSLILLTSVFVADQSSKFKAVAATVSTIFFFAISAIFYPVYSAYNSPLFGGTKTAIKLGIYDNSGEYFAQAAKYLNTKGRDARVFVPDGEASFFHYYKGEKALGTDGSADYVVVSHDLDRKDIKNYDCDTLENSFGGDMDAVYIYSCN